VDLKLEIRQTAEQTQKLWFDFGYNLEIQGEIHENIFTIRFEEDSHESLQPNGP
jgi:hypothetical protein